MYIVTGGAGFIGSNLVRALNRRGSDDILIVDDLEQGEKHLNLNALRFRDYVDRRDFYVDPARFTWGKVDAIFHQGACSDTTERNGRFMLEVNFEASKKLLAFAAGRCPLLYASSAATYGNGAQGFREEAACEFPLNVYGYSKLLFDQWVRRALPSIKTQVVGLRYFNVYGPNEVHKGRMASVVAHFHQQIGAGGELKLFTGSEGFKRDFIHVDDVVAVNLFFLEHGQQHAPQSGIFNCGSGRAESFLALAQATARHYPKAAIAFVPFPKDLEGKYQAFTCADLTRLRRAGFTREFLALEQGVERYVHALQTSGGVEREVLGA